MTSEEIRSAVLRALSRVAPEIDVATLRSDVPIRDQVDIDSMDFLNFVIELNRDVHVEVPEADYPHLRTLDGAVKYLGTRIPVLR